MDMPRVLSVCGLNRVVIDENWKEGPTVTHSFLDLCTFECDSSDLVRVGQGWEFS